MLPECLCSWDGARARERSAVLRSHPERKPRELRWPSSGSYLLKLHAAHASSLIRFIVFLTGWMCSSRSRPFGELISYAHITVSGFVCGGGLKGGSGFLFSLSPHLPRHLDRWLAFSPALRVLPRDWVCCLVWLSSVVFPEDGKGTLHGERDVEAPGRRSQLLGCKASWTVGLSCPRCGSQPDRDGRKEGRKKGRMTCPG